VQERHVKESVLMSICVVDPVVPNDRMAVRMMVGSGGKWQDVGSETWE
jgi:hypothetical protein